MAMRTNALNRFAQHRGRITDARAAACPWSVLACIRISYRAPSSRSKAERCCWDSLMRFWEDSRPEWLRTPPEATQQRRTATTWQFGNLPRTSSCSEKARFRGFLTLRRRASDCMKLAQRILKDCLQWSGLQWNSISFEADEWTNIRGTEPGRPGSGRWNGPCPRVFASVT